MRRLLAKVDRIRASGHVTLNLTKEHKLFHLNGKRYKLESMGISDYKCRVSVRING